MWLLKWRLVASFACVEHGVLLRDRCAVCSASVMSGSSPNEYGTPTKPGGSAHLDASRVPSPGCCPAPVRGEGRRCGAPYADQRAVVVRDRPGLVDAQRLIDAASSACDRDAGDDLHALAVLWALTAAADELAGLPAPPAAEQGGGSHAVRRGRPGRVLLRDTTDASSAVSSSA